MKVNVNKAAPVVTPPPTYDIIGLTAAEEAKVLYDILNCGPGRAKSGTLLESLLGSSTKSKIWHALYGVGVGQLSA